MKRNITIHKIRLKILDLLQYWIPIISEEDGEEGPIKIEVLLDKVIKGLTENERKDFSKETIGAFVTGILECLTALGVFKKVEWSEGELQCSSYAAQGVMKSWLEFLRFNIAYLDWGDDSDKSRQKRIELLKMMEETRLRKTPENELRALRVINVGVAFIKGLCQAINEDVFLFEKKFQTNAFGDQEEVWLPIGGKLRYVDVIQGGSHRSVIKKLAKEKFVAKTEWMEKCLRREINRSLGLYNTDYKVNYLKNSSFPVNDRQMSKSQFQYTEYHFFPFEVKFNNEIDKPKILSQVGKKWFTKQLILEEEEIVQGARVSDRVFRMIDNIFKHDWLKNNIRYSTEISIPYEMVRHVDDVIPITQGLLMHYDTCVLLSSRKSDFEKTISQTVRNFLMALIESKPGVADYNVLQRYTRINEKKDIQKLKSTIEIEILGGVKGTYFHTHRDEGYSLVE